MFPRAPCERRRSSGRFQFRLRLLISWYGQFLSSANEATWINWRLANTVKTSPRSTGYSGPIDVRPLVMVPYPSRYCILLRLAAASIVIFKYLLTVAQFGGKHPAAKPWRGEGPGVLEVVEDSVESTFGAVYTVRFARAVYVLHAFQKKSTQGISTSQRGHRCDIPATQGGARRLRGALWFDRKLNANRWFLVLATFSLTSAFQTPRSGKRNSVLPGLSIRLSNGAAGRRRKRRAAWD